VYVVFCVGGYMTANGVQYNIPKRLGTGRGMKNWAYDAM
jgi:hypothetical protein